MKLSELGLMDSANFRDPFLQPISQGRLPVVKGIPFK